MSCPSSDRHCKHGSNLCNPFVQDFIMKGLETDTPLFTFTKPDVAQDLNGAVITDLHPLASYSWAKSDVPTVIVPGSPRIWTRDPTTVTPDKGTSYIDQNAARMGTSASPLLPLFVALEAMGKEKQTLADHDLVTDRNNLLKLLRWISGDGKGRKSEFRIDIQLNESTVLFTRREEKVEGFINGDTCFNESYESAAAEPIKGCENAAGHHRIVSLKLGSIRTLLRFDVDACTGMEALTESVAALPASTVEQTGSSNTGVSRTETCKGIHVIHSTNNMTPHLELMKVKTRSNKRPLGWKEVYPQLYLSQTPILVEAVHRSGSFRPPKRHALEELESITTDGDPRAPKDHSQACLAAKGQVARLPDLLKSIVDVVKEKGEGIPLALVGKGTSLVLYQRKKGSGCDVESDVLTRFK